MNVLNMIAIDAAVWLIAGFESFRDKPYIPTKGDVPTIGYGSTHYKNGLAVKMIDPPISEQDAQGLLAFYVSLCANPLWRCLTVMPNANQWAAMLSLAYNEGYGPIIKSKLVRDFNASLFNLAADQFLVWDKMHQNGQLVVVEGLLNRRQAERALFLQPVKVVQPASSQP